MRAAVIGTSRFCVVQSAANYDRRQRQTWRIRSFGGYTPRGMLLERRSLRARKVGKWLHAHELQAMARGAQ